MVRAPLSTPLRYRSSAWLAWLASLARRRVGPLHIIFTGRLTHLMPEAAREIADAVGKPLAPSAYIGETEKNLAWHFDRAREQDWVLFFDEADALFGKRTGIQDAHDRYADIEAGFARIARRGGGDGLILVTAERKPRIRRADGSVLVGFGE